MVSSLIKTLNSMVGNFGKLIIFEDLHAYSLGTILVANIWLLVAFGKNWSLKLQSIHFSPAKLGTPRVKT